MSAKIEPLFLIICAILIIVYYITGNEDTRHLLEEDSQPSKASIELENYHRTQHHQIVKERNDQARNSMELRNRDAPYIITGVEECGIKLIERVLRFHSAIKVPVNPAIHFFDDAKKNGGMYKLHLPKVSNYEATVDITEGYFGERSEIVAKNILTVVGGVKVIIVVCDPILRSISDYAAQKYMGIFMEENFQSIVNNFLSEYGNNTLESHEVLDHIKDHNFSVSMFSKSLYNTRLKAWIKQFNIANKRDSLLVMNGNALLGKPGDFIEKIEEFFNLPKLINARDLIRKEDGTIVIHTPWVDEDIEVYFPSDFEEAKKDAILKNSELLRKIKKFYDPFNREIYNLTEDFGWT